MKSLPLWMIALSVLMLSGCTQPAQTSDQTPQVPVVTENDIQQVEQIEAVIEEMMDESPATTQEAPAMIKVDFEVQTSSETLSSPQAAPVVAAPAAPEPLTVEPEPEYTEEEPAYEEESWSRRSRAS